VGRDVTAGTRPIASTPERRHGQLTIGDDALTLRRPNPETATERRQAMAWLTEILKQAAIPADDVTGQARKLGIKGMTLRRARETLGIHTTRIGFGRLGTWFWHLPNGPAPVVPAPPRRAYSVPFSEIIRQPVHPQG